MPTMLSFNVLFVSCETSLSSNLSGNPVKQEAEHDLIETSTVQVSNDIPQEYGSIILEQEIRPEEEIEQIHNPNTNNEGFAQSEMSEQNTTQIKMGEVDSSVDNHQEATNLQITEENSTSSPVIPIILGTSILLAIVFILVVFKRRKGRIVASKTARYDEDVVQSGTYYVEKEELQKDNEASDGKQKEHEVGSTTSINSEAQISDDNPQPIVDVKGKHFLCDKPYVFGDLVIDNPCVYLSDMDFTFAIKRSTVPKSISMDNETMLSIGQKSLNHRDLYFFDQDELSYFLLWLANYKDFDDIPPHCFSRFFDGVFHRALIERRDQLPIVKKVLDIASCYPDTQILVEFLRFVFAVLIDCENTFDLKTKIDIAREMEGLFDFRFYYLKPGWDWDPISWYLDSKLENLIPDLLIRKQKMASEDVHTFYRGLILTQRYMKCMALLKGEKTKVGTPVLSGSRTARSIKNYHDEEFSYVTNDWWLAGENIEKEDPVLYANIDEYLHSDWHHTELVDPSDNDSDISMWLALPPDCQKDIAPLFRETIGALDGKEMSIRELFKLFDKTYPDEAKSIWAIGDYYLRYIRRCIGFIGYALISEEPLERALLSTNVWIVRTDEAEKKKKEILEKNTDPLFTINDKGRLVKINPKVFEFETVHIPFENQGKKIKEIGPNVFSNANMKKLIIDDGIKAIRSGAFCSCNNLESVELPSTLIEIAGSAFAFCKSLKSITIPENVKRISASVFSSCDSLEKVEFKNDNTILGNNF